MLLSKHKKNEFLFSNTYICSQNEHFSDRILQNPSWIHWNPPNRLVFARAYLRDASDFFHVQTSYDYLQIELCPFPWSISRGNHCTRLEIAEEVQFKSLLSSFGDVHRPTIHVEVHVKAPSNKVQIHQFDYSYLSFGTVNGPKHYLTQ